MLGLYGDLDCCSAAHAPGAETHKTTSKKPKALVLGRFTVHLMGSVPSWKQQVNALHGCGTLLTPLVTCLRFDVVCRRCHKNRHQQFCHTAEYSCTTRISAVCTMEQYDCRDMSYGLCRKTATMSARLSRCEHVLGPRHKWHENP